MTANLNLKIKSHIKSVLVANTGKKLEPASIVTLSDDLLETVMSAIDICQDEMLIESANIQLEDVPQ